MKTTRRPRLTLHRETLRRLDPAALARAAGGRAAESEDSKCIRCPLYTLPVEQCPVFSPILRCKNA